MTWTRLHDACQHHESKMIVKLAQAFAEEALMVDEYGSTPLHIACSWGNPPLEVIQALLSARPQTVYDQDIDGNTPLHIAASHPAMSAAVIRSLTEACPTAMSVRNKEGLMPLHMACRHAPMNESVIAFLVEANPGALVTRTKMGDLVIKKHKTSRLMNNEHDDDGSHLYFVTDMAGKANLEATITRYSLGEQIRDGSYPLLMAIQSGTTCPVVQTMLRGNIMENRLLLQTNKFGETALHLALLNAEEHDHGVITMLLQSSKNSFLVEAKEKRHGNLPIHIAAMRGCSATIVDQLLSLEPDSIFGKNRAGKTPLDLAIEYGHCREEVVRLLEISEHH